jgi:hypothetical protein
VIDNVKSSQASILLLWLSSLFTKRRIAAAKRQSSAEMDSNTIFTNSIETNHREIIPFLKAIANYIQMIA